MLPPKGAPLSVLPPGFKSRLLRPSGGFGLEGMQGMWEWEGGVPGRPPQQLLLLPVNPPPARAP
jgi:hypothetical protein